MQTFAKISCAARSNDCFATSFIWLIRPSEYVVPLKQVPIPCSSSSARNSLTQRSKTHPHLDSTSRSETENRSGLKSSCPRNPSGRHHVCTAVTVHLLVIKIDVRPECLQHLSLRHPPRKKASSRSTSHTRRVRITRSWAGLSRAVTSAVLIGLALPRNSRCSSESVFSNFANGPYGNGRFAFVFSCSMKASSPAV